MWGKRGGFQDSLLNLSILVQGGKMLKRLTIALLAVLLVLSNFTYASALTGGKLPNQAKKAEKQTTENIGETEDPNKEVRVIVEADETAAIEVATQKGITFKKMKESEKKQLDKKAKAKQKVIKDKMKDKKVKAEYHEEFTTVVNGFSAEVKQGDIDEIKDIPEVKNVHIVNEYKRPIEKPDMKYSKELVEAQQAWRDYGFKGEGMVVGIIDTGIDPSHRDMVLSDNKSGELTQKEVNETVAEEGLPGKFYTEKVPYGYNYMDNNDEIREIHAGANYHGMHVAGTVGANGDEENGGILGIAPEAQLLALKVFGNDPEFQSTYGDIYVKAIDDSIKLGADVLNMSLGSTAGFVDEDSPESKAISRAVENGVLMSISAGNSALLADGFYYPLSSMPDYGVVGSPGVSHDSLQVASFENTFMTVSGLEYTVDGEAGAAPFLSAGNTEPPKDGSTFELAYAGLGKPADFEGKDFSGKYALVQRGELAFTDKALNAQAAGAEGVIIYNNTDGVVSMATDPSIKIPQLFMLKSDGDKLAAALKNEQQVAITFNGDSSTIQNPDAGKMSDFTSWGLTPSLDFKPEITAPGGQILSTLNDNKYGLMSGTSMAAPHVSGGAALVLERVDEEFGYEEADRVELAKTLMMNTSKKVTFENAFVSPRRQGAGLMQLHAALSTPVTVVESKTEEPKVALKEVSKNKVTFKLTAENHSDKAVKYDVAANVQTDQPVQNGEDVVVAPNIIGGMDITDQATVKINNKETKTIKVPANGEREFKVTIDVSALDADLKASFENGYWLEGFVTLTDPTDTNPELTVPYVGFKGDWDASPIFDQPMWDANSFYGMTGVVTSAEEEGSYNFLGEDLATGNIDPEKIAFSPDGDGVQDDALMILSFLRNAKEVKFNVLDEDKKVVRTIKLETEARKNYYDGGSAPEYSLSGDRAWDGKINGKQADEGQYYLQATGVIDFEDADWQSLELPVILDTTAPEVEASYNEDKLLTVNVKEDPNGSGMKYWDVLVDGKSVLENPYVNGETEHQLKDIAEGQEVIVVVQDNAGNKTKAEAALAEEKDTTVPDLHVTSPEQTGVASEKEVEFSGYVTDASGIKSVTVDGQEADLQYDEEKDQYNFSLKVKHKKDDFYFRHIKAVDNAGNETEIGRRYFVDSEKAKVKVKADKKTSENKVTAKVNVKDAFDDINVYVNGNHVYKHDLTQPYEKKNFNEEIEVELNLEDGKNEFEVKVVDLGGHETVKNITVKKVKEDNGEDDGNEDEGDEEENNNFFGFIWNIIGKFWGFFG